MIEVLYDVESSLLPSVDVLDGMGGAACAACALHGIVDAEVSLSFLSPVEIRKLNAEHRGVDAVTDVLSFPQLDVGILDSWDGGSSGKSCEGTASRGFATRQRPRCARRSAARMRTTPLAEPSRATASSIMLGDGESVPVMLGDIVICTERALAQADEYGHSTEREFVYLFVHGLLHLLGYDHEDDDERAEMRAVEEDVLRQLNMQEQ